MHFPRKFTRVKSNNFSGEQILSLPTSSTLFYASSLSLNEQGSKTRECDTQSLYKLSFIKPWKKSQKETVISKVFMDVKSPTARQIPFVNVFFVRKVVPEF